jgi:hypothetical protein
MQLEGVSEEVCAPYQTRIIVRDVSGKYTWDSTLLYGPASAMEGKTLPALGWRLPSFLLKLMWTVPPLYETLLPPEVLVATCCVLAGVSGMHANMT